MAEKKNAGAWKNSNKPLDLLTIDFNNLMAEAIGPEGMTDADLDTIKEALTRAEKDVSTRHKDGELPFMDLPLQSDDLAVYQQLAVNYKQKFDTMVVLGIGGSALGTKAVFQALKPANHNYMPSAKRGALKLLVADNIDPESFAALLEGLDIRHTVFNVISKSGATAETMSQFMVIYDRLRRDLGKTSLKDHLLITTDPLGGVLRKIADSQNITAFAVPPGVGGRFSVLTAVGLAPLAAAGVDIAGLLQGAALCRQQSTKNVFKNHAYLFAGLNWFLNTKKKIGSLVMMPYADALGGVADWFGQLWNESLGKGQLLSGKAVAIGQTAIKAVGATDQHSQLQLYMEGPRDKTVCFIRVENFKDHVPIPPIFKEYPELSYLGGHTLGGLLNFEQEGTARALASNGRPNLTLKLPKISAVSLGYLLYMLELATVVSGSLYKIDPLNQPGVELGKKYTYGLMGREGFADFKTAYQKGLIRKKKCIIQ